MKYEKEGRRNVKYYYFLLLLAKQMKEEEAQRMREVDVVRDIEWLQRSHLPRHETLAEALHYIKKRSRIQKQGSEKKKWSRAPLPEVGGSAIPSYLYSNPYYTA